MLDSEPVPRPKLDENGDLDDWLDQFRVLFYVLRMTHRQIAEIDYGFDPDHPDRWMVFSWEATIRQNYPRMDWQNSLKGLPRP